MKYKCSVCSKLFKDLKQLLLHRKTHSNITPKRVNKSYIPTVLICDVCYRTFKTKAALERHMKSHYLPVRYRHSKRLVNTCELEEHEKQHEAKVLSCHQCDFSAYHQVEMLQHLSAQHSKSNSYICQLCDAEYDKKNYLERHVKIEHSSVLFICEDCGEMFDSVDNFKIHCKTHFSVDPLQLPAPTSKIDKEKNEDSSKIQEVAQSLGVSEIEASNLAHELINSDVRGDDQPPVVASSSRNHDKNSRKISDGVSNHEQIKHCCGICGSTFKSLLVFKIHKSIHENVKSLVCDICGEDFVQEDGLRQHVLTHATTKPSEGGEVFRKKIQLKGRNYKCEACKMAYTSKNALERHLTTCSKQYVCRKKFPTLYDHMKVHQKKKNFVCDTCGKNFLQEDSFRQHMLAHTGHKCSKCGEVFKAKVQLDLHMNQKYKCLPSEVAVKQMERPITTYSKGNKPHLCEVCGKGFYRQQTRDNHMKDHEKKNNFNCDTCGEDFLEVNLFQQHMLTHTSNKCESGESSKLKTLGTREKYVCEVCGKTFLYLQSLKNHTMQHESVRNFACPQCGKRFVLKEQMRRHSLVHSNYKPFKCSVCDKSFRNSSHLKRHVMWHTGQKPYKCELCHKQCIQKVNLKRHVCRPL